ncbi:helix-turn-helix domain-containing protein [Ensifer sp. NBAIM29]|nr:helix-turn-helix domain-containing protein [Ensifer sp. NBAIM29]
MGKPESAPKTELGARIRDVRRNLGDLEREAFATKLGISKNTLAYYERGERTPDVMTMAAYRERFGVNLNWIATGEGDMFDRVVDPVSGSRTVLAEAANALPAALKAADFVNLPQYDVRASAGRGLIPFNEMPVSETAFERSFLRNLGGAPDHCFMMWSTGDSMSPTIPENALLIVDSSQTLVDDGRIYVFAVGNTVLVKRAKWRLDGRLELASDNVAGNYPVETFNADRVEDLTVVGRVIFIGHPP